MEQKSIKDCSVEEDQLWLKKFLSQSVLGAEKSTLSPGVCMPAFYSLPKAVFYWQLLATGTPTKSIGIIQIDHFYVLKSLGVYLLKSVSMCVYIKFGIKAFKQKNVYLEFFKKGDCKY